MHIIKCQRNKKVLKANRTTVTAKKKKKSDYLKKGKRNNRILNKYKWSEIISSCQPWKLNSEDKVLQMKGQEQDSQRLRYGT